MINILPQKLILLAKNCPFPLYVVGGTCRDFIMGIKAKKYDFDICAPYGAEEFCAIASACGFTVNSVYKNAPDLHLCDKRGKCNAIYYNINEQKFCDPLGGIEDIQRGQINTVREAEKVFGEDGLRLMRLARFASTTGLIPTKNCLAGAIKNCRLIDDISPERIFAELDAILHADEKYGREYAQYNGLLLLKQTGVLHRILPEITMGYKMLQRKDYHDYDVLEHSLRAVKYADKSVRLACLLHDIAKPYCYINYGRYSKHDIEGEKIAKSILRRLKVSKKLCEETAKLVLLHMYDLNLQTKEGKVRKFMVQNYSVLQKLYLVKQADFSACKDDLSVAPCVARWKKIEQEMILEGVPFNLKQLKIKGDNLIKMGIAPEKVGKILQELLFECALNGKLNSIEHLIIRAEKLKEEV